MKKFFRIIYAYIILVFFYGLIIKITVDYPLLFSMKTYLPDILIGFAVVICLLNIKNYSLTKIEFIGILYFYLLYLLIA